MESLGRCIDFLECGIRVTRLSDHGWNSLAAFMRREPSKRLTLVVGAGVHAQWRPKTTAERKAAQILTSWEHLVDRLHPGRARSGEPLTVTWERLVTMETRPQALCEAGAMSTRNWRTAPAYQRERALQKAASRIVAQAEATLLGSARVGLDHLHTVLGHAAVSDIITLNFDTIVERALMRWNSGHPMPRTTQIGYATVKNSRMHEVRVWHLHGSIRKPTAVRLGLRHYAAMIEAAESRRMQAKAQERAVNPPAPPQPSATPPSWVSLFLDQPLLFLGVSLSEAEWDLWKALADRMRNYAKAKNHKHRPPAWILSTPSSHCQVPTDWIQHLEERDWDTGWKRLAAVLASR